MPVQRMKKPGGNDTDAATMELGAVEIPDVSGQLQRLTEAAESAGRSERREKKQRDREREEMMRCCGIRF